MNAHKALLRVKKGEIDWAEYRQKVSPEGAMAEALETPLHKLNMQYPEPVIGTPFISLVAAYMVEMHCFCRVFSKCGDIVICKRLFQANSMRQGTLAQVLIEYRDDVERQERVFDMTLAHRQFNTIDFPQNAFWTLSMCHKCRAKLGW